MSTDILVDLVVIAMRSHLILTGIYNTYISIHSHKMMASRSSRPEVFCKTGVLGNFAKFTGKHLCQNLFFNKVAGAACNFIKKETLA